MKYSWSIFTKTALTLTVLSGVTPVNAESMEADIYLDALDADGHLSILEISASETEVASSATEAQAVKAIEPKAEKAKAEMVAKTEKVAAKVNSEYSAAKVAEKLKSKYPSVKEAYAKSHDSKADVVLAAAPKTEADAHGKDPGYSKDSADKGFLTKGTTEIEFTFAILVIVIGLIASERFQRAKEEQMQAITETNNNEFHSSEDS